MKHINKMWTYLLVLSFTILSIIPTTASSPDEPETTYPITTTSNSIPNWPIGPDIKSSAGVVIEASTGTVLYDKNMNETFYPASITKIMTAILAIENSSLHDTVTFSENAVFSIPRDSSHIAITPNETLSMEDALYGLLLASANEVANAIAEHVGGSTEEFVKLMNERAKELGAKNTNFINPSGLPDVNHYTSCYDMAMISRAAVSNDTFCVINGTTYYEIPSTNLQPESRHVNTSHKLLLDGDMHYEGCFGGKTGYTVDAGETLVTFAKRDGMTLISVVMRSTGESAYIDSTALLDYGFANFKKWNVSSYETNYSFENKGIFENDFILDDNNIEINMNPESSIILPINAEFIDALSEVSFTSNTIDDNPNPSFGNVTYTYNGHFVGSSTMHVMYHKQDLYSFTSILPIEEADALPLQETTLPAPAPNEKRIIHVNIWYLLIGFFGLLILILAIYLYRITSVQRARNRRIRRQKRLQGYHRIGRRGFFRRKR